MAQIVGRESELQLVRRFLAETARRCAALHLHGDPGIGKSTLWHVATTEANDLGYRVLATRPTEAEARLPFSGLTDLFGELLDEVRPELPAPQRSALEIAFRRSSAEDLSPEPLAISLGVLTLVRAAAADRPVVVAVDDTPWLDESSAIALDFVMRRLDAEPVGLLAAERTVADAAPTARLVSGVHADRIVEVPVAPLSMDETDRLLGATLGLQLAPSTLRRLHRTAGGNPFYAVEIGRAMQRRGDGGGASDLPMPEALSDLIRDRLDELSVAASDVVEQASALSQPTVPLIAALLGPDVAGEGVEEAVAAHVIALDGEVIRFTHPLLAAELYGDLGDVRRRDLHRRLAAVVSEPEEHARHVALAADGPDESVASELERAAERAHRRGAPDAAADLVEQALELTVSPSERSRRLQFAARYRIRAGDGARARRALEEALAEAPAGDHRGELLLRLAEVRFLMDDWGESARLLSEALEQLGTRGRLEVEIRLQLAGVSHITARDWEAGAAHVAEAMRLAEALGDPEVLARTIGPYATWQRFTGTEYAEDLERRAAELEPWTDQLRAMDHPHFDFSFRRWEDGDVSGYRAMHQGLLERAERSGDYTSLPFLQANFVRSDFMAGSPEEGVQRLETAERLARATQQTTALAHVYRVRTYLMGRLGRADEAWAAGRNGLAIIAATGWTTGEPDIRREIALLELSRRSAASALDILEPFGRPPSASTPWVLWQSPVHAEALIGLGRLAEARDILEGWKRLAPMRASSHRMRHVTRATALLEAAEGDLDAATRSIGLAAEAFAQGENRWGQARTALVAGEIHRRARRRSDARKALEDARRLFTGLGATLWAAQATDQLQRLRAGRDEVRGLTPTQTQVAELAVEGLTNRQIGDRLFMSVHTVEAHLSSAYRTLGITSRRHLADALRDSDADVRDSPPGSGADS